MKVLWILVLVVIFLFGMSLLDGDSLLLDALVTPNPTQLTARASQQLELETERLRADSTLSAAAAAAEAVRFRQTETEASMRQTAAVYAMRETEAASRATSMANATITQQAWNITATAAVAQATATAEAEAQYMRWTQQAIDQKATDDTASGWALATSQAVNAGIAQEQLRQEQIRTERADLTKKIQAATPYIVIGLLFTLAVLGLGLWSNVRVIARGADGAAPVLILKGKVVNADRAIFPVTDPKQVDNPPLGAQMRITENDQKVATVRALSAGGRGQAANRVVSDMSRVPEPPEPEPAAILLPDIAPWDSLSNWTGNGLPLGIGPGKMGIQLDPERTPHLLVAGTSGSGKTMGGLRPMGAFALATGWLVVLMNEAGGDFAPLKTHPNLTVIEDGPAAICHALEAVVEEVERRSKILSLAGVSTYSRMPNAAGEIGPRIMVMVDELVALAMQATGSLNSRIWQASIHITSKGRKMGLMFVAATTDPTYRTLGKVGLIVRDNCGRLVFRMRDRTSSMGALDIPDAAMLGDNQFIAQLDSSPVRGVAFHPTDQQLAQFIEQRRVPLLPKPEWIKESPQLLDPSYDDAINNQARDDRIRELAKSGKSMNDIQREVFGYTGGSAYDIVRAVLASTTGSTTGTSTTDGTENPPNAGSSTEGTEEF